MKKFFLYVFLLFFLKIETIVNKTKLISSFIIYCASVYGIYKLLNKILINEKEKDHKIKIIIKKIRDLTEHIKNYEKGHDKENLKLKINSEIDNLLDNINFIYLDSVGLSVDYKLMIIKLKSIILALLLGLIPSMAVYNS